MKGCLACIIAELRPTMCSHNAARPEHLPEEPAAQAVLQFHRLLAPMVAEHFVHPSKDQPSIKQLGYHGWRVAVCQLQKPPRNLSIGVWANLALRGLWAYVCKYSMLSCRSLLRTIGVYLVKSCLSIRRLAWPLGRKQQI